MLTAVILHVDNNTGLNMFMDIPSMITVIVSSNKARQSK